MYAFPMSSYEAFWSRPGVCSCADLEVVVVSEVMERVVVWRIGEIHVAIWCVHYYSPCFWAHGVDIIGSIAGSVRGVFDQFPCTDELIPERRHRCASSMY